MKRHIKPEEIRQMRGNMFKLEQMGVNSCDIILSKIGRLSIAFYHYSS